VSELWICLRYQELCELMKSLDKASFAIKTAMDRAAANPDHCQPRACLRSGCKERINSE